MSTELMTFFFRKASTNTLAFLLFILTFVMNMQSKVEKKLNSFLNLNVIYFSLTLGIRMLRCLIARLFPAICFQSFFNNTLVGV